MRHDRGHNDRGIFPLAACWAAGLTSMAVPERPPEAVTGGRADQTL
jgi:hypothetical protein